MTSIAVLMLAATAALAALTVPGCRRGPDAESLRRTATVGEALRPSFYASALRRMGGAHFHGTARFAAGPPGAAAAAADAVTTTTDVWLDRQGNYRLVEVNDRDGGREVVLTGRELAVALRYGKMIRRPAEEPEPTRLLEEALGAPWAAWEVAAPAASIERAGTKLVGGAKATVYKLALAPGEPAATAASAARLAGVGAWRGTVSIGALAGTVVIDDATGAVTQVDLTTNFTLKQDTRTLGATAEVHAVLTDVASTAAITRPAAEDLALRQRIVPEQRELLGGLPTARAVEPAPRARASDPAASPRGSKP